MFASFKSFFTAVRDFFTADPYYDSNTFLLAAKPTSGGTNITFADAGPNGLAVTRAGDVLATGVSPFIRSWSTTGVGASPIKPAVNPAGTKVYVPNSGSASVSVIDTSTNAVTATITVGTGPYSVCFNATGTLAYAANQGSDNVSVIDTATETVTATIVVGDSPRDVAITPNGAKVYAANQTSGTISVIDTATNAVTSTITGVSGVRSVAVNDAGTKAYFASGAAGAVWVVDTSTDTITATITGITAAIDVLINGDSVYVGATSGSSVYVIDGTTDTLASTITIGGTAPRGLAVNSAGTRVYTANGTTSTVSVIDTATNKSVGADIAVDAGPFGVVVSGTKAFVTCLTNGKVAVLKLETFESYQPGGSAYFDGSGDRLTIADTADLNMGTGDFTFELWFNAPDVSGTHHLLAKGASHQGTSTGLALVGDKLVYFGYTQMTSTAGFVAGTWNHAAASRSGTTTRFFLNGVLQGSFTDPTDYTTTGEVVSVGDRRAGHPFSNYPYLGLLSNVRIVKGTALYTAAFTPPTEPLTAIANTTLLLPLDDGAVADVTGLNRVSLVGNTSSSATAKFADTGSVYFDGVGDTMTAPHSDGFNFPGDFTIDFWVQPVSGTQNGGGIVCHRRAGNFGSNGAADWIIRNNTSNGTIAFGYDVSGSEWNMGTYTLGQWSHHAISRSGSTIRTFKNGELVTTATNSGAFTVTTGLELGNNTGNGIYYKGYMQDVRVTKGVARYTEAFTPPTQPSGPTVNVGALPGGTLYVATFSGLSISTDGGKTFINRTTANGLGNDLITGVSIFGSTVYVATLTGLSVSTDGGATFSSLISGVTVRWGLYVSGSNIYSATIAGLAISTDSGATFAYRTTSDGMGSNNCFGLAVDGSNIYVATVSGLAVSTNGGATFTNRTTANGLGSNVINNVFVNESIVYAGTSGGLSISTDGGATFTNRTTANGLGDNSVRGVIVVGSTVYAGTASGLSISTDGGATFINRTTANGLGNDVINYGLFVSGSNVCVPTTGGLSISTDGGATFTNRNTSDGLASNSVNGVTLV